MTFWDEERYGPAPKQLRTRDDLSSRQQRQVELIEEEIEAVVEGMSAMASESMERLDQLFTERFLFLTTPTIALATITGSPYYMPFSS